MKQTQVIMKLDEPNKNGHIYTTEAIEQAIARYKDRTIFGQLNMPDPSDGTPGGEFTVDMAKVSHRLSDLRIENGELVGNLTILATPDGELLQKMMEGTQVAFRSAGTGMLDDKGVVTDFKLISINAVPAEEAA